MHVPRVYISQEQIQSKVRELGQQLTEVFEGSVSSDNQLVVIGVLKGAYIFTADLVRNINLPLQIEFVRIASYGDNMESNGVVSTPDLSLPANIQGKNILIVEDIVDTGQTAKFLTSYIQEQFYPSKLVLVSFLNKQSRRVVDINPDYTCFDIEDKFVVGYGLDYAEQFRQLPYLGFVDEAV